MPMTKRDYPDLSDNDFLTADTAATDLFTVEDQYYATLHKAGNDGCGTFQFLLCLGIIFGLASWSWLFYGLSFLELLPQFDCQGPGGTIIYDCSTQQICNHGLSYSINYTNDTSLHNWVE